MKIDDILSLTKAGWTKDEIMSLINPQQEEQQPVEQPAEPETAPPDPQPAAAAPVEDERLSKIETQLDYAIKRLNYLSVKDSQQPDDQKTETVDDILSSIINPKK